MQKYNMIYDDLHDRHLNIKDFKGVNIQAHKIEVVRQYFNTLEVFMKNGDIVTYKKDGELWKCKNIRKNSLL